jgi:hypothetical protein
MPDSSTSRDEAAWTSEDIEACKRAGWYIPAKSQGLPGYYPSEAMRAFRDGYRMRLDEQRGAANQQGCSRSEASVATERTDRPAYTVSETAKPISAVSIPLAEAINEPCKGCGKRPIDFISGTASEAITYSPHRIQSTACAHDWPGPGPMPAKWDCSCGTRVYRSREDAIDD